MSLRFATALAIASAPCALLPQPRPVMVDARMGLVRDPRVAVALADVSPARIRQTDSTLVAFGTRNSFSDTTSATRGIGAARRWIYRELRAFSRDCGGCLRVEYDPLTIAVARAGSQVVNVVNVLAWLPGRDTSRVLVMGGHYDSCVCNINGNDGLADAPGANDDGSGTSAVIELARVVSKHFTHGLDATVIFALYAAEEQGLLGSTHLAQRLHESGYRVVAALTDDIVGNVVAEDGTADSTSVRVYAVDSIPSGGGELARYVWGLGQLYTPTLAVRPTMRLDRLGRGGDHAPFHRLGIPALRFTERLENYKRQHLPTDGLKDVNPGYVANVARLNLATVVSLAGAPAAPDSAWQRRDAASGGQKWAMRWKAVDGAASYEILVRSTVAPTYTRVIPVAGGTAWLLDEQLDDAWAAVRTVSASGARSLTTVFVEPPRSPRAASPVVRPPAK